MRAEVPTRSEEGESMPTPAGRHLLADLYDIASDRLTDEQALMELILGALQENGCHVLAQTSHKFSGENAGVTGLVLLSESHAAFHTYPERGYMAMDVFVCGAVDPRTVLARIEQALSPKRTVWKTEIRGSEATGKARNRGALEGDKRGQA